MKKTILFFISLFLTVPCFAQLNPLNQNYSFTATGTSSSIDVRSRNINYFKINWSNRGPTLPSACTVILQTSNDNITFSTGISGTCTTNGASANTEIHTSYVRINLSTYTAAGSPSELTVTITGVNSTAGDTSGLALETGGNLAAAVTSLASIDSKIAAATDPCFGAVPTGKINAKVTSTTLVKIVSASSSNKNYLCSLVVINKSSTQEAFSIVEGTKMSTECDTGASLILGSLTAADGMAVGASGLGFKVDRTFPGNATNKDWCIQITGSHEVNVTGTYVQAP